jgi:hypothetical protein
MSLAYNLSINFAQIYSQDARYGIFILKIFLGMPPRALLPTQQKDESPTTPSPIIHITTLPSTAGQQIHGQASKN